MLFYFITLLLLKPFLSSFSLSIIVSLSLFINNPCNVRWVYVPYTHFMMPSSSGRSDVVFRGRKSISIFIHQGFRMTRINTEKKLLKWQPLLKLFFHFRYKSGQKSRNKNESISLFYSAVDFLVFVLNYFIILTRIVILFSSKDDFSEP